MLSVKQHAQAVEVLKNWQASGRATHDHTMSSDLPEIKWSEKWSKWEQVEGRWPTTQEERCFKKLCEDTLGSMTVPAGEKPVKVDLNVANMALQGIPRFEEWVLKKTPDGQANTYKPPGMTKVRSF